MGVLLLLALLANGRASAAPICGALEEALPRGFSTPQDQGGTNWCNAYVAADLAALLSGRRFSAAHVAAAGHAWDLERRLRERESDPRRTVWDDTLWLERYLNTPHLALALGGRELCLESGLPASDAGAAEKAASALDAALACLAERPGRVDACLDEAPALAFFAPDRRDARRVLAASKGLSRPRVAERLMSAGCRRKRALARFPRLIVTEENAPKGREPDEAARGRMLALLDATLARGGAAAVAFVSERLSPPPAKPGFEETLSLLEAGHVVTALGRFRDPESGECLYLLRNSWGEDGCRDMIRSGPGVLCGAAPGAFAASAERLRPALLAVESVRYARAGEASAASRAAASSPARR